MTVSLTTPLTDSAIEALHAGDAVSISGVIYVARDAAHKRIVESLQRGEPPPFDLRGQIIYYMGPSPAKPGRPIGSAGPTTSYRMDPYTEAMLEAGVKGFIGKGMRSPAVRQALTQHRAVYLASIGGAGALISQRIVRSELVAYEDLGAEAVLRLEVQEFPAVVVNDIYGGDLYEMGKSRWQKAG